MQQQALLMLGRQAHVSGSAHWQEGRRLTALALLLQLHRPNADTDLFE